MGEYSNPFPWLLVVLVATVGLVVGAGVLTFGWFLL
jgi:hypothetical protein